MQDSKAPKPVVDTDATSKETLADLEQDSEVSESNESDSKSPSPDGALDQDSEVKDAGPM